MTDTSIPQPPAPSGTKRRRPEVVRTWQAIGGLLAVAAVGWSLFSVVGLVAYDRISHHQEYDQTIDDVAIDSDSGSVTVVADGGDHIAVTSTGTRGLQAPSDQQVVDGTTLRLRSRCHGISNWCELRYTVHVPRHVSVDIRSTGDGTTIDGVEGPVVVHNDNGSVRVRHLTGRVEVTSDNGRIIADDIRGDISLQSDNGGIRAQDLRSDQIDASTSNGSMDIQMASAPRSVTASSSNGSLTLEFPRGPESYDVDTRTSNGRLENNIHSDPNSDRRVQATTSNGGIELGYTQG